MYTHIMYIYSYQYMYTDMYLIYIHILIPIQVHRYVSNICTYTHSNTSTQICIQYMYLYSYQYKYTDMYPIYVHVIMESCTFFRYGLKMFITEYVVYSQSKFHSHIPNEALRVRKYFILIGHAMSCDYYIISGVMSSFCF